MTRNQWLIYWISGAIGWMLAAFVIFDVKCSPAFFFYMIALVDACFSIYIYFCLESYFDSEATSFVAKEHYRDHPQSSVRIAAVKKAKRHAKKKLALYCIWIAPGILFAMSSHQD